MTVRHNNSIGNVKSNTSVLKETIPQPTLKVMFLKHNKSLQSSFTFHSDNKTNMLKRFLFLLNTI